MSDSIDPQATRRDVLLALVVTLVASGCGHQQRSVSHGQQPAHAGSLDLKSVATAAGLQTFVAARPRDLWEHPVLGPSVVRYIDPHRRRIAFELYGFDFASIDRVLYVDYSTSVLWLLAGIEDVRLVEKLFRARMRRVISSKRFAPECGWIEARAVDGTHRGFARLDAHTVALEIGGASRVKASVLYTIGKLQRVPTMANFDQVKVVEELLGDASVQAVSWGPFEGQWAKGLGGMLAVTTSIGGAVRPSPNGELALRVVLSGAWQDDAPAARAIVASSWQRLSVSPIGRLLSFDDPKLGPKLVANERVVRLDVVLDGTKVLRGLYNAVKGSLEDIMSADDST